MQVIIIALIPANFRRIRTEYFGYTMEQVAKATNLSVGTIRNAEVGIGVSKEKLKTITDFYAMQELCRRQLNAPRKVKRNV